MAEAEVAAEVEVAAEEVAEEGTPLQEDRPQATQPEEEETIDSSDNPQTYSLGIAPKRRSFSRNGSSTTI